MALDLQTARAQLASPATWCDAAAALASSRDPQALAALVDAYDLPVESSKLCLLEAMEALGRDGALEALHTDDPSRALRAASLVADARWLPLIEKDVVQPATRALAAEALRLQRRDTAWEEACLRLLVHADPAVRLVAAELLAGRKSTAAAVEGRRAVETDPAVKAALSL